MNLHATGFGFVLQIAVSRENTRDFTKGCEEQQFMLYHGDSSSCYNSVLVATFVFSIGTIAFQALFMDNITSRAEQAGSNGNTIHF
jgi:hypothetical protein